jgi:pteridine reductase
MNAASDSAREPGTERPDVARPVALVTGAGRRIGRAVAGALAAKGYRLVLHVNHSLADAQHDSAQICAAGGSAIVLAADLREPAAIEQLLDETCRRFGRIDALVNCAAIWSPKPLEQITPADVREYFEVNELGTFLCCQRVGLRMAAQAGGGAIVNFGDWAITRPYPGYAAYFPSKGAIPTLTRTFAVELGRRNRLVRVNAVLPGPILFADDGAERQREAIEGTLVRRAGTGQDIAQAVIFLIENTFVTGVCLPVDGGRSIFAGDAQA